MFDELDFSWRDFAHEFIPLLGNWLKVTQKNVVLKSLKAIVSCLKELHKTCDSIYDDVQTFLLTSKFYNHEVNEDDIIEYVRDFDIGKYFRDESILDPAIYQTCVDRSKENCLNYPQKICEFKKKHCLRSKKIFSVTKKVFLTLLKKIIYSITKNFFCRSAP